MAQRTIEEVFRSIAPRRKGVAGPGVLTAGVSGGASGGPTGRAAVTRPAIRARTKSGQRRARPKRKRSIGSKSVLSE